MNRETWRLGPLWGGGGEGGGALSHPMARLRHGERYLTVFPSWTIDRGVVQHTPAPFETLLSISWRHEMSTIKSLVAHAAGGRPDQSPSLRRLTSGVVLFPRDRARPVGLRPRPLSYTTLEAEMGRCGGVGAQSSARSREIPLTPAEALLQMETVKRQVWQRLQNRARPVLEGYRRRYALDGTESSRLHTYSCTITTLCLPPTLGEVLP